MVIDPSQMAGVLGSATMNVGYSVLYGVFAGLGFTVAIVLLSGLREKVDYLDTAKTMKGFPVTMVTACFIAMAFYVFNLISL